MNPIDQLKLREAARAIQVMVAFAMDNAVPQCVLDAAVEAAILAAAGHEEPTGA